jgi:TonB family protein
MPADPALPDSKVYSAADAEVAPPAFVRTRLPAAPSPAIRADELPEVEVVVSPAGDVESVKLLTQPTGVGPAMMLSAIKNWRFHPATRDGQPVRYRLRIRLTNR